jgi:ferritin-like metal-binding protein YciE
MPIRTAEELFFDGLSDVYAREQRMAQMWENLSQKVQDPEVKDLLSVRAHFERQAASNIEKCFQILGRQPSAPNVAAYQAIGDHIRDKMDEIESPALKAVYALAALRRMHNWGIGEYAVLTAMAGRSGNWAVAVLLEHNLADQVDFIERRRERIRERIEEGMATRAAGRAA